MTKINLEKIHNRIKFEIKELSRKIEIIAKIIVGVVLEIFSIIALAALYFISQRRFDPKEKDIVKDETGRAVQQPIVLVHGYLHNSSGWIYHRHKLKKAGFKNVFTVDLGAIPNKSIAEYSEVLNKRIQEINQLTGRNDVKLIGHSMGGVVSSYYAINDADKKGINVTDVITLNSPLRGTKIHFLGLGPCARNMAYGSDFIKELSQKIKNSTKTRFFHFASRADFIIFPYFSELNIENKKDLKSRNQETTYIAPDLGHTAVLFSNNVINREIELLQ